MLSGFRLDVDGIASLRHLARRHQTGLYFVEGARFVIAAVDAGARIEAIVVAPRLLSSPMGQMLARRLRQRGTPELRVSPAEYARISSAAEPPGVGAVIRQAWCALDSGPPDPGELWVALHRARSPGNVGTLMRTCAAVGATGVVVPLSGLDPYDPATVRASMGAALALRMTRASFPALREFAQRGRVVVGAAPQGTVDFRDVDYRRPVILLLGSERTGLSNEQRALCDVTVRIPMVAGDSLNLGVAASLLLYAAWSHRHPGAGQAAPCARCGRPSVMS